MELELVEVTIGGVPATKEKVREHLRKRIIDLPKPLAKKMIDNYIRDKTKTSSLNEVFSNNI